MPLEFFNLVPRDRIITAAGGRMRLSAQAADSA
jgi:hypothetical protein